MQHGDTTRSDRRKRLLGGTLSALVGTVTAAVIFRYPEELHTPAWVAYAACSAFVFAGLAIIAHETELRRTRAWLAVAFTVALFVPGAWIAFGPGERECSLAIPFFTTLAPDLLCRGAFGLGALIGAAFLTWIVLRAIRQQGE